MALLGGGSVTCTVFLFRRRGRWEGEVVPVSLETQTEGANEKHERFLRDVVRHDVITIVKQDICVCVACGACVFV